MKNLLIFLLMSSTLLSQEKYIHAGKIYDSNSGKYHLNKTELCQKNQIKLIHIFEDEWLYKQDIVKGCFLNHCYYFRGLSNFIFGCQHFIGFSNIGIQIIAVRIFFGL